MAPPFSLDGREIWLVDTPGFDDTSKTDSQVLEEIGEFMTNMYKKKQLIAGIIYMHRITDNRFGGVARKNFRIFRELCGPEAMKNLIICTNMWPNPADSVDSTDLTLELRERELITDRKFFQVAIEQGARVTRYMHYMGIEHAHGIVRMCLENIPVETQYQVELGQGVSFGETSAGRVVNEEMRRLIDRHKYEIAQLKKDHEEAIQNKKKKRPLKRLNRSENRRNRRLEN